MKTKKILIACLAATLISALLMVAMAQTRGGANSLLGSWKVRVTPSSPQALFDEMMTFSEGGGIVESNNYPFNQLGLTASAGHGTWAYEGNNRFGFTFIKFLHTQQGQFAGTLKVRGVIVYSPATDTWVGLPANVEIFNPAGQVIMSDLTRAQATRILPGS